MKILTVYYILTVNHRLTVNHSEPYAGLSFVDRQFHWFRSLI